MPYWDASDGQRLAEILSREGWTQRGLARAIGVRKDTVHGWVTGSEPGAGKLREVARNLEVSVDELLGLPTVRTPEDRRARDIVDRLARASEPLLARAPELVRVIADAEALRRGSGP